MNFYVSAVLIGILLTALQVIVGQKSLIQEAAVIIAHSDDLSLDRLLVNDSTILLMCAAYGVPLPIITWTSPSQGIVNYSTTNTSVSRYATVNSTIVEDKITNLSIVVSVLELCVLDEQNTTIVCEASNGIDVENPIGVSAIIFGRRLITIEKPDVTQIPLPTEPVIDKSVVIYIITGTLLCIVIISIIVSFTVIMVVWLRYSSKSSRSSTPQSDVYRKYHNARYEQEQSQNTNRGLQRRENEVYHRYNNELYEGNQNAKRTREDSLYYCAAYDSANPQSARDKYEYAYVETSLTLEKGSTNTDRSDATEEIFLQRCEAYGAPSQALSESKELAYTDEWLERRKRGHTYEEIM